MHILKVYYASKEFKSTRWVLLFHLIGVIQMIQAQLLASLRAVRDEHDLLACLSALANWFPQSEKIGDALLDCILIIDDHLNN